MVSEDKILKWNVYRAIMRNNAENFLLLDDGKNA